MEETGVFVKSFVPENGKGVSFRSSFVIELVHALGTWHATIVERLRAHIHMSIRYISVMLNLTNIWTHFIINVDQLLMIIMPRPSMLTNNIQNPRNVTCLFSAPDSP